MPSIPTNSNSTNFSIEIFKKFIEKCQRTSDLPLETVKYLWETELKVEARKTFTLISLELYEDLIFKDIQNMTNSFSNFNDFTTNQKLKQQRTKSRSRGSLRKSLTSSGSIGSISSRIRSHSLLEYEDGDFKVMELYLYQYKFLYYIYSRLLHICRQNALKRLYTGKKLNILQKNY